MAFARQHPVDRRPVAGDERGLLRAKIERQHLAFFDIDPNRVARVRLDAEDAPLMAAARVNRTVGAPLHRREMRILASYQHLGASVGIDPPKLSASRPGSGHRLSRAGRSACGRLELASGSCLEMVRGDSQLAVVIVDRRHFIAGEVVDDLGFVVQCDLQHQRVVAGAGIERPFAVARERHDVGSVGLVDLSCSPDRVDREHLPLWARACDQLTALLVVVQRPDVFRASRHSEAFQLPRLGLDSVDASVGQGAGVECAIAPERQRCNEQLPGVREHLGVLAVELVDDTVGAGADEPRAAALRDAVGQRHVLERGPPCGSASPHRPVGMHGGALELALEKCVRAVEVEAFGGYGGDTRAGRQHQACQHDSDSGL